MEKNIIDFAWSDMPHIKKYICKDMLRMLDDTGFFDKPDSFSLKGYAETHRVIDTFCQSGTILNHVFDRFNKALSEAIVDFNERKAYIYNNLLFSLGSGVAGVHKYDYDIVKDFDKVSSLLGDVSFGLVIACPPTSYGKYADYVINSSCLNSRYFLVATQANFLSAKSKKFDSIRQSIVPRIIGFVHWQNGSDIFPAKTPCGICYFLADRSIHDDKFVINRSSLVCGFVHEKCVYENFSCDMPLLIAGRDIVFKLGNYKPYKFDKYNGKYKVWCSNSLHGFYVDGSYDCVDSRTSVINPLYISPDTAKASSGIVIFSSDNKGDCESFISYLSTKFVRFLILIGATSYGFTLKSFRYVPDEFFHGVVFEDSGSDDFYIDDEGQWCCGLYAKYGLSESEVSLIESVIK